jgi:ribosome biogenesis protein UTP30
VVLLRAPASCLSSTRIFSRIYLLFYSAVKIGTILQTPEQILANLKIALPAIIANIRDGWDNIQNLMIKTNSSASLPIWTCDFGEGKEGRWNGLVAELDDVDEDVSEADERANDVVMENKGKGKRRASEVTEEKDEGEVTQKKKAKKGVVKSSTAVIATETVPSKMIKKASEAKASKNSVEAPAPPPPTKDELKKKLSKSTGEKKLKGKSSLNKSAKAKLLGKKALD